MLSIIKLSSCIHYLYSLCNVYKNYFHQKRSDWNQILNTDDNKLYCIVVGDIPGDINFKDPHLTVNGIAEKFQLNTTYVSNMFKKEVGYNILQLIHIKRVEESKDLLENTELSISEISVRVGFYNHRTFSSIFKRVEKVTPSEFRQMKKTFKLNSHSVSK